MLNVIAAIVNSDNFYNHFTELVDEWFDFWESGTDFDKIEDYVDIPGVLDPTASCHLAAAWTALARTGVSNETVLKEFNELLKYIAVDRTGAFVDNHWKNCVHLLDDYLQASLKNCVNEKESSNNMTDYEVINELYRHIMSAWLPPRG